MACTETHSKTDDIVKELPIDQGKVGRHKCASCAYEIGFEHGLKREEHINLNSVLNSIKESQKGDRRHRSPHSAYSLGYFNGVMKSYE
jgi:hypothetical protein